MMKHTIVTTLMLGMAVVSVAQQKQGGITPQMLQQIARQNTPTTTDRALRNALAANAIDNLAKNQQNARWIPILVWRPRSSRLPTRSRAAVAGCSAA